MAGRMSGYRAGRRKGGRAGRPRKIPAICREGVGTNTVVQGKGEGWGGGKKETKAGTHIWGQVAPNH